MNGGSEAGSSPNTRMPCGLLGMLAIVVGCEVMIAQHEVDLSPPVAFLWKQTARSAVREAPGCDILCLGDSQMKSGVAPLVLEQRLGRKVFNLAMTGAEAPASYYLLRRTLHAGARPRLVLVDFKPLLLSSSRDVCLNEWARVLSVRDTLEMSWTAHDPGFCAGVLVRKVVPSFELRDPLRARIIATLTGQPTPSNEGMLACWRNSIVNRGATLEAPKPEFWSDLTHIEAAVHQDRRMLYPEHWECDPLNLSYLRRFFALATAHGIRVVWLLPPHVTQVQVHRDQQGLDLPYLKIVEEIQSHYRNVMVVDGRYSGYEARVFTDPVHLDGQGAARLTAELAEILRPVMAHPETAPKWAALPAFRSEPVGIALENALDSWKAIKLRGAKR